MSSRDVQLIEGWLWKAKWGMTTTWKKHFVRADNNFFYQYSGTTKPTKEEEPKYLLDLHQCKIRTSNIRKFAFEIVEHGGKPMTFATDDSVSYKKWIKILTDKMEAAARIKAMQMTVLGGENNAAPSVTVGNANEDQHTVVSGLQPDYNPQDEIITQEEEILMQHIMDGAKSFGDGRLNLDIIRGAIRLADSRLQEDRIIALVKKSTVITADGKISVYDFRKFWREHAALLLPTQRGCVTAPFSITHPTADSMSSLSSGALCEDIFLNGAEDLLEEVISPVMLRMEVPMLPAPSSPSAAENDAPLQPVYDENWDFSQLKSPEHWYRRQLDIDNRIAQLTIHIDDFLAQRSSLTETSPSSYQTEEAQVKRQQLHRQILHSCEELYSLWEHFYHTAIRAAQCIGDEYILPTHMKTLQPVETANHTTVPSEIAQIDTYVLDGVHVQLLSQHLPPEAAIGDTHAISTLAQLEDLLGKIAETELKESEYLNNTLDQILWSDKMDILHLKRQQADHEQENDDEDRPLPHFSKFLKVKRCFRTIVDYSGMRFVAFVPSHDFVQGLRIDDNQTQSVEEDAYEVEDEGLAILEDELCAGMNIRYAEDAIYLMEWTHMECVTISASHPQAAPMTASTATTVTRRYVHGQVDQLLPADLCRPQTHDALVKRLRPEFVKMFCLAKKVRLKHVDGEEAVGNDYYDAEEGDSNHVQMGIPSLFSLNSMGDADDEHSSNNSDSNSGDGTGEREEKHMNQLLKQKTREWTTACGYYYKQHIPFVANLLDTFQLQPFDSYSLSQSLHTYGVNLRHLGILFSFCKNRTVKQLLFAEIFARSVKRLYRDMMSAVSKEERQRTIYAFNLAAREKSQQIRGNTVSTALQETDERGESVDRFLQQRQSLLLLIVNRILRRDHLNMIPGKKSVEEIEENNEKFFQMLFGIIQQKFGLTLRSIRDLQHCPWHPNQVFLAMQYHLQVRFKDDCYSCIEKDSFVSNREFTVVDVIDFFLPKHRRCTIYTEDISYLLQMKHRFLSLDLMTEATALYQWEHHLAQQSLLLHHLPILHQDVVDAASAAAGPPATTMADDTKKSQPHDSFVLSWQRLQQVAHLTYQHVLCLLLQSRFDDAFRLASQYLASSFTCLQSAISGRILAMVISAAYRSRRHGLAMHAFDGSLALLQRALPEHHPALALPMLALADSYLAFYDQQHCPPMRGQSQSQSNGNNQDTDAPQVDASSGLQQAKWLLQMAWTTVSQTPFTSSTSSGNSSGLLPPSAVNSLPSYQQTSRFAFALQYRLANLLVVLGEYREAMQHFQSLLRVIDYHQQLRRLQLTQYSDEVLGEQEIAVAVASVYFQEKLRCLYHLCLSHYHCEEHDIALQFGQQTLQSASFGERHPTLIRSVLMHDHLHAAVQRVVVSTLLICYDIHTVKNETEIALEMLQAAWKLLRGQHPVFNANGKWYFRNARHIVQVLTQVSLKTMEMALAALPLQSRITLEALAKEYVQENGGFDQQSLLLLSSVAAGSQYGGFSNKKQTSHAPSSRRRKLAPIDDDDDEGVEGQEKGDWHDAEFGGGPKLVRLQGEVLNPIQVVQFACVAVADVLWLGLGVDYVHWLLQRQTLAQQAGDLSDANWNRRGDNRAAMSSTGATMASTTSPPVAASNARQARRGAGSPLKAAAIQQHNGGVGAKGDPSTTASSLPLPPPPSLEDTFLLQLPGAPSPRPPHGGVEEDGESERLWNEESVPVRTVIEALPVAAQAAAVLMLLQQPQDFVRFVVGANLLRQSNE